MNAALEIPSIEELQKQARSIYDSAREVDHLLSILDPDALDPHGDYDVRNVGGDLLCVVRRLAHEVHRSADRLTVKLLSLEDRTVIASLTGRKRSKAVSK